MAWFAVSDSKDEFISDFEDCSVPATPSSRGLDVSSPFFGAGARKTPPTDISIVADTLLHDPAVLVCQLSASNPNFENLIVGGATDSKKLQTGSTAHSLK